jgi:hypothetical protein
MLENLVAYLDNNKLEVLFFDVKVFGADVTNEDLKDYWNSFSINEQVYDLNICQTDKGLVATIYEVNDKNEIETEHYFEIPLNY